MMIDDFLQKKKFKNIKTFPYLFMFLKTEKLKIK